MGLAAVAVERVMQDDPKINVHAARPGVVLCDADAALLDAVLAGRRRRGRGPIRHGSRCCEGCWVSLN